jgi:hypothetical protein
MTAMIGNVRAMTNTSDFGAPVPIGWQPTRLLALVAIFYFTKNLLRIHGMKGRLAMRRTIIGVSVVLMAVATGLVMADALLAQSPPGQAMEGPPMGQDDMMWDDDGPGGQPPMGPPDRRGQPGRGRMSGRPPGGPQQNLESLKKSDPEMYKLRKSGLELMQRIHQTATKYRKASADQQEKIKQELTRLVAERFDVNQQVRTLDLKRRETDKLKIVDQQVSHLLSGDFGRRGPRPSGQPGQPGRPGMGPPNGAFDNE